MWVLCIGTYIQNFRNLSLIKNSRNHVYITSNHRGLNALPNDGPREKLQRTAGRLANLDVSILGDTRLRNPLLHYIHNTNIFQETHGNLHPPASTR